MFLSFKFQAITLSIVIAAWSTIASAATIRASSTFNSADDTVITTLYVGDLGNGTPPSLGAFDLDFLFDPSVLAVNRVVFGNRLGSPDQVAFTNTPSGLVANQFGSGDALSNAALAFSGRLNLLELSLLEADATNCFFCSGPFLDDLQGSEIVIAGIQFNGLVNIPNANRDRLGFNIEVNGLSDAFGQSLSVSSVSFNPVPTPPTLWLIGIGVLAMRQRLFLT
jgi:hypothetical protein